MMNQTFHGRGRPSPQTAPRPAFTLVELLVVVGIIAVLVGILVPVVGRARESANRLKCGSNLRSIGQLITSYAAANKGSYPRTFYDPKRALVDAVPKSIPYQPRGATSSEPFAGTSGSTGANNVPAALFLLIRTQGTVPPGADPIINYEAVAPETFICPSAPDVAADPFEGGGNRGIARRHSNFSWLPTNLSYSYANPYPDAQNKSYRLNANEMVPDFVVAADYNPGKFGTYDVTAVTEASTAAELKKGNSANHKGAGQNVLYGDGRVEWQATPFCGKNRDNIYTVSGSTDGGAKTSPVIEGSPTWQWDSILLPALGK